MERLRAAGCPVAPTSLEEGVRRYVQDYLTQTDRYR
jgi:ADP-L-glycero-D-manno-heptose 6-epimerase